MRPGWRVGRLAGIEIAIHPSWLVIAFLVTYSLAEGRLPSQFPGWGTGLYWAIGAGTALLFFASVLAHELSHAIVARRLGMQVNGITLFIFGGATELAGDAPRARDEALVGIAGPLSSLLIGGGMLALNAVIDQPQATAILGWLGIINIMLGIFNLIPAFPLDGGRVFRAIVWRVNGDRLGATRVAATVGRVFAYLMVGGGIVWSLQTGDIFGGLWLALIGWFLSTAAESTAAQAGIERALAGVRVRDVMDAHPPSVSPNESVAELVQERMLRGEDRSFLVRHPDGGLAGVVTLGDVRRTPREQWDGARVTDIMTRWSDLATVGPDDAVSDALKLLAEREVSQLPVVMEEGREPVGLLTRHGILRLIETRMKLGV
jgi:Zn-dependent protease